MKVYKQKDINQRFLLLITAADEEQKLNRMLQEIQVPIYYQCYGQGTAASEILDICGLRGTKRLITVSILPKPFIYKVFYKIDQSFSIKRKGKGVAATIPVNGMQNGIRQLLDEKTSQILNKDEEGEKTRMKNESKYSVLLVAVNYGYSDEVVHVARNAGAKGGTVLKGRRRGLEEVMNYLRVSMQEEQELILIIIPEDNKSAVMSAVSEHCGLNSPAQGIILSLPVEDVIGLRESHHQD